MATNAIDLTTVANVKAWAQIQTSGDDQIVQDAITAFSAYVLKLTARGPADGSIPATSPFVTPVSYDEVYDGNGNNELPLRNWPITAVALVNAGGIVIPASGDVSSPGYVIDQSKKFLVIRYGGVAYPYGRGARGPRYSYAGWPLGTQNVEVQYTAGFSGVPFDLEMLARKVCALNYRRRSSIGQKSQAMAAGAGTISFGDWEMDKEDMRTIDYYRSRVA